MVGNSSVFSLFIMFLFFYHFRDENELLLGDNEWKILKKNMLNLSQKKIAIPSGT